MCLYAVILLWSILYTRQPPHLCSGRPISFALIEVSSHIFHYLRFLGGSF